MHRVLPLAMFNLALVTSCGGNEAASPLEVIFQISKGGRAVQCGDVAEIQQVEVRVMTEAMIDLPAYPKTVDCAPSRFPVELPPGKYIVVIEAKGSLAGEGQGTLYYARSSLEVPDAVPPTILLQPVAASVSLTWAFGSEALVPCGREVASIGVTVSPGTSGGSYHGTHPCDATPIRVPAFFRPQSYTVLVSAFSREGFLLYEYRRDHGLEPGENAVSVALEPQGGRILFAWRFATPSGLMVSDCAHPEVAIDRLVARVTSPLGDEPVEETLECDEPGAYFIRASRFSTGRPIELTLVGEGTHRYRFEQSFRMPMGDKDLAAITLRPVGNAFVEWEVGAGSGCAALAEPAIGVVVLEQGARTPRVVTATGAAGRVEIADLPYATYDVAVFGGTMTATSCQSIEARVIDRGGDNAWRPFSL